MATSWPPPMEQVGWSLSDEGVAVITISNPGKMNAFSSTMADELNATLAHCDLADEVRVVVLTGEPPAFCAGADLSRGAQTFVAADRATFRSDVLRVPPFTVRKPVIAAVNGHAIGVGLTIPLMCDIRLFARDARYGVVQVRRGVLGDGFVHWTLPRLAGHAVAAEILLRGHTFDGDQALGYGLCSQVLPNDEVLAAALDMATDMALQCAPVSMALSKQILWRSWTLDRRGVADAETAAHLAVMSHADVAEGALAAIERRPPRFTGAVSSLPNSLPAPGPTTGV